MHHDTGSSEDFIGTIIRLGQVPEGFLATREIIHLLKDRELEAITGLVAAQRQLAHWQDEINTLQAVIARLQNVQNTVQGQFLAIMERPEED